MQCLRALGLSLELETPNPHSRVTCVASGTWLHCGMPPLLIHRDGNIIFLICINRKGTLPEREKMLVCFTHDWLLKIKHNCLLKKGTPGLLR